MDTARRESVKKAFAKAGYHALVCRTPQHVVMLTGYQPILGNSFCLVSLNKAGEVEIRLAVPEDERDLVPEGVAVAIKTFSEETMHYIGNTLDAVREALGELLRSAGLNEGAVVGYEGAVEPIIPAYTQVGVPAPEERQLLHVLLLGGYLRDATMLLDELAAIKTESEIAAIRRSEQVACVGFEAAREAIRAGATEAEVAAATTAALLRAGYAAPGARHVLPYVHVMAGRRAALAYRAFNLTGNTTLADGDTVMVQMEIGINGYWAELTRTFFVGSVSAEWRKAHQACMAAQDAALKSIRDGVEARVVDRAAREVMQQAGLGTYFKHGLGHGFGFQAINHSASPVLHPASKAVLARGMVHNMEPAVYIEGKGGIRLNDNVLVRKDGNELLSSSLPRDLDWLVVSK
ncbi:MAG TPA: Xaa-Pro peptidase family protein [Ktedonobacteraceae bacterium]|jgi:Xaa-Pro aminopeptidase|nr:Xaa-Pro peptidase family protein [Ktedonobacteraceae bacterium]